MIKAKLSLVLVVFGSVIASNAISYKWHEPLGLRKHEPEIDHTSERGSSDTFDYKGKSHERDKKHFDAMPLKCQVGNYFTLGLGRAKDLTIYMAKYAPPKEVDERVSYIGYRYIELKPQSISGRGYNLIGISVSDRIKISIDYEISSDSKIYLHLNEVKEYINSHEYGDVDSTCYSQK